MGYPFSHTKRLSAVFAHIWNDCFLVDTAH